MARIVATLVKGATTVLASTLTVETKIVTSAMKVIERAVAAKVAAAMIKVAEGTVATKIVVYQLRS